MRTEMSILFVNQVDHLYECRLSTVHPGLVVRVRLCGVIVAPALVLALLDGLLPDSTELGGKLSSTSLVCHHVQLAEMHAHWQELALLPGVNQVQAYS